MGAVENAEQARMVHQPVRPVEIRVMRDDDRGKAEREIADPGGLEIRIDREDAVDGAEHDRDAGQREDDRGPQRGQDFAADVGARGRPRLDLAPAKPDIPEQFQDQGQAAGRDRHSGRHP